MHDERARCWTAHVLRSGQRDKRRFDLGVAVGVRYDEEQARNIGAVLDHALR